MRVVCRLFYFIIVVIVLSLLSSVVVILCFLLVFLFCVLTHDVFVWCFQGFLNIVVVLHVD